MSGEITAILAVGVALAGFDLGRSLATMFTNRYMDGITPLGLSL